MSSSRKLNSLPSPYYLVKEIWQVKKPVVEVLHSSNFIVIPHGYIFLNQFYGKKVLFASGSSAQSSLYRGSVCCRFAEEKQAE